MIEAGMLSTQRERRYRRRFALALLASTLLHTILLFGVPAPRQWNRVWSAPHIGQAGPELFLGELNPQDSPVEEQEILASARREAGALVEEKIEIEPEGQTEGRIVEQIRTGAEGRDRTTSPVLELSEDWALRSSSAPTSRTKEFVILQMVRPHYPEIAIAAGIEGIVKVQAWIDTEGLVKKVEILDSGVDSITEDETLRAMRLWRFRPYRVDGQAIEFSVIVPFRFRLE